MLQIPLQERTWMSGVSDSFEHYSFKCISVFEPNHALFDEASHNV